MRFSKIEKKIFFILLLITSLSSYADMSEKIKLLEEKGYEIAYVSADLDLLEVIEKYCDLSGPLPINAENFLDWNPHVRELKSLKDQYVYIRSPFSPYIDFKTSPSIKQSK